MQMDWNEFTVGVCLLCMVIIVVCIIKIVTCLVAVI